MNDGVPRHPEARIMAAFVDGALGPDEVQSVAAHLSECRECRLVVAETARFEREEEARPQPQSRRAWIAIASIAAAIAVVIPMAMHQRASTPMARLISAAPRDHRVVEGRLSGFQWARLQAPSRGTAPPNPADLKLAGAAGDVLEKSSDAHANGVAYLLIDRRAEAVAALERAAQAANDAHVWSDLAAARYAIALRDDRPSQLPEALADADHALRIDPRSPEALFNRALIIESLGLRDQARAAWTQYLEVDPSSGWATEAREHLRKLEQHSRRFEPRMLDTVPPANLVAEFPQEARVWTEGVVLGDWADALKVNDSSRAASRLTLARNISKALVARNGELLLSDQVSLIDSASSDVRASLAEGHRLYRDGRIAFSKRRLAEAQHSLDHAAAVFAHVHSPMANVAAYFAANVAVDANRVEEGREELLRLQKTIDGSRHAALAAEIHWQLTICANIEGDWDTGAREADGAASIFRRLGERTHAAFLEGTEATSFERVGEGDLAWKLRVRSLGDLDAAGEWRREATILHAAAITLASIGRTAAASSVLDLMTGIPGTSDPAQLSFVEADRARYAARGGDLALAAECLTRARAAARRVPDAAMRETLNAQIDLAKATLDPAASLDEIDQSLAFFSAHANAQLPEAYLARARALRTRGDESGARAEYEAALAEVEKQRTKITNQESRMRFLDTATDIIDETIELLVSQGDGRGALDIAERAHAIRETGAPKAPNAHPTPLDRGTAVIEYAVLPRGVVVFRMTNDGFAVHTAAIDRQDLEERVRSFTEAIRRRAPVEAILADSSKLHHLLIEPFKSHLAGVREIIIVPDDALNELPFAALWDAATHQYLTEEFVVRYAPSAARSQPAADGLAPAVIFADPPTALPHLAASREEATRIAAMYGAQLIVGEAATRAAFISAVEHSALIHYAGHADGDVAASHAALLLARSGSDPGILGSNEIERLTLRQHPLVVLAACGTAGGDARRNAGRSSLARAFLIAGARAVAGTLWEVDDDVSAAIFLRFHEHIRAGMRPAAALRGAQLDLMQSHDPRLAHPAAWAPVKVLSDI